MKVQLSHRRAFAMPIVLFLCLISSLFLVAALERRSNQRLSVQRQITEYRRHHEMFGVRAIARKWLEKSFDQLPQIVEKQSKARKGEDDFAYGFELPSGAQIRVFVRDGQGAALSDLSLVPSAQARDYEAFLSRVPEDRPNLRRRAGQPAVSINSAPREVLAALVEAGGASFADKVMASRQRKPIDHDTLESLLRGIGTDDEEKNRVFSLITLEPSLWRLDIEVTDEEGQRLFTMLTERPRGKIEVYEWLELAPQQGEQADVSKSEPPPASCGDDAGIMSLHPDKAARVTRIAQASVVGAAALALAAWTVLRLPEPQTPETSSTAPVTAPRAAPKPPTPTAVHADWTELAPILAWATPPAAPDAAPGPNPGKPGGVLDPTLASAPTPGPTLPSWRYLGFVRRADAYFGLVSVDGRQKFVSPGQKIGEYTVASIDPDHLQVTQGAESHRIDLIAPPGTDGRAPAFRQTTPRPIRPNRAGAPAPAPAPRMDANSAAAAERDRALEREREKAKEHAGERPQR